MVIFNNGIYESYFFSHCSVILKETNIKFPLTKGKIVAEMSLLFYSWCAYQSEPCLLTVIS